MGSNRHVNEPEEVITEVNIEKSIREKQSKKVTILLKVAVRNNIISNFFSNVYFAFLKKFLKS